MKNPSLTAVPTSPDRQQLHTPGPWHVGNKGADSVFAHDGSRLCIVMPLFDEPYRPSVEDLANARLIAASPDLLSALTLWVKYFDKLDEDSDPNDMLARHRRQFHASRVEVSRAAIAKALGAIPGPDAERAAREERIIAQQSD